MIIPLSSTLKVSANAYTILRETREQTVLHEDVHGLQAAGFIPDGSAPIEPDPPVDNTPRITIPTVSTTTNLPSNSELPPTTCTTSRGIDEPDAKARRSIGLQALAPLNPYRIRRRQEAGPSIGETGDSFSTATDSGSSSLFLTSSSSTPDSLPPSSTSSSAPSNSDSETPPVIFPIPVPSSSSSTSETSNDSTSTVLPRATTETSSASGISDSILTSPIITLPVPSSTSTLASESSTASSPPSTFSPPIITSQTSTSSPSTLGSASSTNASGSTSSFESSLSSSAIPTLSNLSTSDTSTTTSFEQSASGSIMVANATQTSSFSVSSPVIIYTSSTIANNGATSSAMETVTTTFVTTKSGTPATITTVIVGPSGSLNDAPGEKRKGLPAGAIAAISIISVLAVAVVGLWLFLARRRRRRSLTGVRGSGAARSTPDGGSTMRSLGAGLGLGPGAIYGLARARTDSAGVPIRTSPLDDEDAYLEAPHSSSAHSGFTGGPNSLEGGLMRETNVGLGTGSVFDVLPAWMSDHARADESGHGAERVRGGNESGEKGPEGLGGKVRERGLLLAAGLASSASIAAASPQPHSSSSSNKEPFVSPKRTSFAIDPYPQVQRDRSVSPRPVSPTYASILPTRSAASDLGPRPSDEDRRASVRRSNSGPAYLQLSRPPSAWSPVDSPRDKGKEREKENRSATPSPVNEPNMETFGRKRSSVDLSSSSHGHGYGALIVTSSQGHGSATASGENEPGTSSGAGSSGSHQGSVVSHTRRKSRRNSEDEGFFARAASLTRTNLRNRLRRVSASGISSHTEDVQSQRTTRPPSPVSRLVTSTPHVSTPTLNIVVPPSPSSSLPSPRVTSMLVRSQAPGPLNLPPVARSAMTRAAGPGSGLPAIMATPSPLPTPDTAPDGLLDPRLTARLREIHAQQASFSTIGLRDDEDYSRPIYALVNNRDSMTSASSEYSQPSQSTTNVHTPTQPEMCV